jgi:hypothetical protein
MGVQSGCFPYIIKPREKENMTSLVTVLRIAPKTNQENHNKLGKQTIEKYRCEECARSQINRTWEERGLENKERCFSFREIYFF